MYSWHMKTCLFVFVDDQNSACVVVNHTQLKCSMKKRESLL